MELAFAGHEPGGARDFVFEHCFVHSRTCRTMSIGNRSVTVDGLVDPVLVTALICQAFTQ